MPIRRFHRQIAELVLRAASPHGFALAGGNALIVHGLVERGWNRYRVTRGTNPAAASCSCRINPASVHSAASVRA